MAKGFKLFKKWRGGAIPLLYEKDRKTGKRYEYKYVQLGKKGSHAINIWRREK